MIRTLIALAALAFAAASFSPAAAQLTVLPPGFNVKTLPPSVGTKQLECSPGGVWGNYVYAADSSGGAIERIDFADNVSLFASGLNFPVGLEFGPGPGANFGTFLYVAEAFGGLISRVDTSGVVSPFAPMTAPSGVRFDPSGVYGTDLFVVESAFAGPIVTLPPAGGPPAVFSSAAAAYVKFGPGGAWGSGMYSTSGPGLVKIDAAGVASPFVTGLTMTQGFDWAFGGDLFATDVISGEIYRVDSTGAKTLWATLPGAADVAFCNSALYVVSNVGGCYKVTEGVTSYCTAGTSASGCQATMTASGTASASASSGFCVSAADVEGNKSGIFFYGTNGRQANPWGNGTSFQCVTPPVKRGGLLAGGGAAGACDGAFTQDLNARWCAACPKPGHNPGAGATMQSQLWYRDPMNTSNQTTSFSDAIEFDVGP